MSTNFESPPARLTPIRASPSGPSDYPRAKSVTIKSTSKKSTRASFISLRNGADTVQENRKQGVCGAEYDTNIEITI